MENSVNNDLLERVRSYNLKRKEAEKNFSTLKARAEYAQKEVLELCSQLSSKLGIDVTIDNLESIRNSEINKIINNLEMGEEIIKRIEDGDAYDTEAVAINMQNQYANVNNTKSASTDLGELDSFLDTRDDSGVSFGGSNQIYEL